MADKELAALTSAGTLDGDDLLYIVDIDGNSRKVTLADLKTFINTDPTIVPSSEPWRGCRVYRTSDLTGLATGAVVTWQAEALDTDTIWSIGAPTRLTVPSGVTKVRLRWGVAHESLTTAGSASSRVNKNGGVLAISDGQFSDTARHGTTGFSNNRSGGFTGVLSVVAGDYFELQVSFSMTNQDQVLSSEYTFFEMEIVEG